MLIEMRAVPHFYKNGFVLACEETRESVIIDPGDEVDQLLEIVRGRELHVAAILLTHGHVDHVCGAGRAKSVTDAPIHLHEKDLFLYRGAAEQGQFFGLKIEPLPPVDRYYDADQRIAFGRETVRVRHTPGHSPGGVCLHVEPADGDGIRLFVGDTLFAGSIGRTDLPGGDHATLIRSINEVLFPLGDSAIVYPGHGETTTIGEERLTNPFFTD